MEPLTPLSGLALSHRFFVEAVRPLLSRHYPALPYTAALIGPGSEVLGFDDAMSQDHHWGPRLQLFLQPDDHARYAVEVHETLRHNLPPSVAGVSTHFSAPDPDDGGVRHPIPAADGPVDHMVAIETISGFATRYLGSDLSVPLSPADWLSMPEQRLRTFTGGAVFHDAVGLQAARAPVAYYPRDVWLYQLAAVWTRLGQEEHLMGRAGFAGDELGAALIGARLVRDLLRLWFLMARTYAPYPKWLGTAFNRLPGSDSLGPPLTDALAARDWQTRERHLVTAYEIVARRHNSLGLTPPLPEAAVPFHGRPFRVIAQEGFAAALAAEIVDPDVVRLLDRPVIGGIDLVSDNTDILENSRFWRRLRTLYV